MCHLLENHRIEDSQKFPSVRVRVDEPGHGGAGAYLREDIRRLVLDVCHGRGLTRRDVERGRSVGSHLPSKNGFFLGSAHAPLNTYVECVVR